MLLHIARIQISINVFILTLRWISLFIILRYHQLISSFRLCDESPVILKQILNSYVSLLAPFSCNSLFLPCFFSCFLYFPLVSSSRQNRNLNNCTKRSDYKEQLQATLCTYHIYFVYNCTNMLVRLVRYIEA